MRVLWLFIKANIFPLKVLKDYLKFSSVSELIFDLLFPSIFPFLIVPLVVNSMDDIDNILNGIDNINKQSLTSISILAGFNVASISVLATSGSNLIQSLRKKRSKLHPKSSLFEKIMTFFSAAIVLQFFIILIGIILLTLLSFDISIPDFEDENWIIWIRILIGAWIYLIIVSIFVSIRNLKTLFIIIISESDEKEE